MDSRMTFAERCLADYWACRNMLLQRYVLYLLPFEENQRRTVLLLPFQMLL